MPSETVQILTRGLAEWSIELTDEQAYQFTTYASLLIEWNTRINLTRLTRPHDIAVLHFLDSLALFKVTDIPQGATLLDIGTGAGFPGLAIKILRPDLRVTLLEGTAKKLSFCRAVIEALGLEGIETVHGRAEEMAGRPGQARYDRVVARAVAPLEKLLPWAAPFVRRPSGLFVAWKGVQAEREMEETQGVARRLGLQMQLTSLPLPQSGVPAINHAYILCRHR